MNVGEREVCVCVCPSKVVEINTAKTGDGGVKSLRRHKTDLRSNEVTSFL